MKIMADIFFLKRIDQNNLGHKKNNIAVPLLHTFYPQKCISIVWIAVPHWRCDEARLSVIALNCAEVLPIVLFYQNCFSL
jgi:hypothetical protein